MMLLVYSANNQLGGGCLDRADAGLSLLGQRVVEECNRVGIVLDLSHTGHVTADIRSWERNIEGFDDYAQIVDVAKRLRGRGYSESDVRGLLGENFLRVFGEMFG